MMSIGHWQFFVVLFYFCTIILGAKGSADLKIEIAELVRIGARADVEGHYDITHATLTGGLLSEAFGELKSHAAIHKTSDASLTVFQKTLKEFSRVQPLFSNCFLAGKVGEYHAASSVCGSRRMTLVWHPNERSHRFVSTALGTEKAQPPPRKSGEKRACGVTGASDFKSSRELAQAVHANRNIEYRVLDTSEGQITYYLDVGVVSDAARLAEFSNSQEMTLNNAEVMMFAAVLFRTAPWNSNINVYAVLTTQSTMTSSTNNAEDLLTAVGAWRVDHDATTDATFLFSGRSFEGNTKGLATLGGLCRPIEQAVAVGEVHTSDSVDVSAKLVAHELAHLLGIGHDGEDNSCNSENYIMAPAICPTCNSSWSSCSENTLLTRVFSERARQTLDQCLLNRPTPSAGICGDGFVSGDEECDCGGLSSCPCCDANTCRLHESAACSSNDACCDTSTCSAVAADTICRSPSQKAAPCLENNHVCDGVSVKCPAKVSLEVGTACDYDGYVGKCYNGLCHSYGAECYSMAVRGFDAQGSFFVPCNSEWLDPNWGRDDICEKMVCKRSAGQCSILVEVDGSSILPADGVPCGDEMQCKQGRCVLSTKMDDGAAMALSVHGWLVSLPVLLLLGPWVSN
ncbi:MAG: hypothetical protein MHM6MM_003932 [Cercozoa sp. M6MM]